jgi:hypothetical protein
MLEQKQSSLFVERILDFSTKDKEKSVQYKLKIYQPIKNKTGEYQCLWELEGSKEILITMLVYGADSLQALVLTLECINVRLSTYDKGSFNWMGLGISILPRAL